MHGESKPELVNLLFIFTGVNSRIMMYSAGPGRSRAYVFLIFILLTSAVSRSSGQSSVPLTSPSPTPIATPTPKPVLLEKHFITNIVHDQTAIWTAPFKPGSYESKWAVPLGLTMAGLIATDRYTSQWVSINGG